MKEAPIVDTKEFELPKTVFSRDIETRVIQVIILQCLSKIQGVGLIEGNLIDTLLGRTDTDRLKGIFVEQDSKNHQVKVKVEILVKYGISIPKKAEEVQTKVVEEITHLTGLHVATVHVVIKGLVPENKEKKEESYPASLLNHEIEEEEVDAY
ncbi:MAG: Asp23/Gls24 family envelope stress response protein [Chlamydiales bacterium]